MRAAYTQRSARAAPVFIKRYLAGDSGNREVSGPAAEFLESPERPASQHRKTNLTKHLVGVNRGSERPEKEIPRSNSSRSLFRAQDQLRIKCYRDQRPLRSWVRMNETSTDGSPIANSKMSDLSGRSRKQRLRQACRFRNFEMAMTGKGADAEHSILSRDE